MGSLYRSQHEFVFVFKCGAEHVNDTPQFLSSTAANVLAKRTLNVLREQNRLKGVIAVIGVREC